MNKYLKSFIIGSSYPVFFPFFFKVSRLDNIKKYSYKKYSFIAPLFFGLMNMLSNFLLSNILLDNNILRKRLIFTGIISPIIVMIYSKINNIYDFSKQEWNIYYIRLFIKHFITYNITIYILEKYI